MKRHFCPLLYLTLSLNACSQAILPTKTLLPGIETPSRVMPIVQVPTLFPSLTDTRTINPTSTPILMKLDHSIIDIPIATPTFAEQCGGMYPTELYSLSWIIDDAIKTLEPNAEGRVEAVGQGCIADDGKSYFHAFGIWFYIDKPTPNLKDNEALGSWILDVMNLLDTIPRNEYTINAEHTIVNFRFYVGTSELLDVRVLIKKYLTEANSKSGEELFRMFYTAP